MLKLIFGKSDSPKLHHHYLLWIEDIWKEFFQKLRPAYKLASSFRISTTYLNTYYTEMKEQISTEIKDTTNLYLQCEQYQEWEYNLLCNFKVWALILKITKAESQTADYLAEQWAWETFTTYWWQRCKYEGRFNIIEKYAHIIPLVCIATASIYCILII